MLPELLALVWLSLAAAGHCWLWSCWLASLPQLLWEEPDTFYGPARDGDGSVLYDDGLVIKDDSTGASIPSRLWIRVSKGAPEREEEQFDPMEHMVKSMDLYLHPTGRDLSALAAPSGSIGRGGGGRDGERGEQALADEMRRNARDIRTSKVIRSVGPVHEAHAEAAGLGDAGAEGQTGFVADTAKDDTSYLVKEGDMPGSDGRYAHRNVIVDGAIAVGESEWKEKYGSPTVDRAPKDENARRSVDPPAARTKAKRQVEKASSNNRHESSVLSDASTGLSSRRGSLKPTGLGSMPSPPKLSPHPRAPVRSPPLYWSEEEHGAAVQAAFKSPLPTASTPFTDDGSDWMGRDGSYFPAELRTHASASSPTLALGKPLGLSPPAVRDQPPKSN